MSKVGFVAALAIAATARLASAQSIPATVQQAEAEGAGFAHDPPQAVGQSFFTNSPFGGTADRRCAPGMEQNWAGALRSGDFILRGRVQGTLHAGQQHKLGWFPLHGSASHKPPLVVRAARVGNPADSIHFRIDHITHGGESEWGYPRDVSFPTAGQWLVVATAGNDWGCFLLDVDP